MESFNAGEQVWLILIHYRHGFGVLNNGGLHATNEPATSVTVVRAIVLEAEDKVELADGTRFDLPSIKAFHSQKAGEETAEQVRKAL